MTLEIAGTILGMAIILAVTLALIHRYPLRFIRRRIHCRRFQQAADVTFERAESGYGSVAVRDVQRCSLFRLGPITCDKDCLRSPRE